MSGFWKFVGDNWWWFVIFGGGAMDWVLETFDAGIGAWEKRRRRKRRRLAKERQLELQKLAMQLKIAEALSAGYVVGREIANPGPCKHRRVSQVRDRDDNLVAWLCKGCDTQLPADWAVAAEDL